MSKKYTNPLLVLLLSLAACTSTTDHVAQEDVVQQETVQEKAGYIVFFFDKAPVNGFYTLPGGGRVGRWPRFELRYIDDYAIDRYFTPKLAPEKDTLIVYTQRDIVEIQHAYKGLDVLSYLFHNGDSVLFTYDGNKPSASVLNRTALAWDVNYDLRKRELLSGEDFPGLVKIDPVLSNHDPAFQQIKDFNKREAAAREAGFRAALAEQGAELKLLDSLKQHQLISDNIYQYYREKSLYDLSNESLIFPPSSEIPGLDEQYNANELIAAINRPHENYFYYDRMRLGLRVHYFENKVPFINTPNGKFRDYRQVYDSIQRSTLFSERVKHSMLFSTVGWIIQNFSIDDRQAYWDKFKKDVPDTVLRNYLVEKYALDQVISDELFLKTTAEQTLSFTDVLAQHKGKVVFVDFWASWCAPCIRAFPASKQMQNDYKDKDIVFVYLSIDEDAEKWQKATTKYLAESKSNYLVENLRASRMLEDLKVQSIPRYLIYDREGKLVHQNAPGPGSTQLKTLIDQQMTAF